VKFREFIIIFIISLKNAIVKIKSDKNFHKVLGITYTIEKVIKKNKNF